MSLNTPRQDDKFICVDIDGNRLPEDTIKLMPDQNPKAIDQL